MTSIVLITSLTVWTGTSTYTSLMTGFSISRITSTASSRITSTGTGTILGTSTCRSTSFSTTTCTSFIWSSRIRSTAFLALVIMMVPPCIDCAGPCAAWPPVLKFSFGAGGAAGAATVCRLNVSSWTSLSSRGCASIPDRQCFAERCVGRFRFRFPTVHGS
eukprot:scaffold23810_cov131-Isochrysis_galbana.AAC.2